MGTHMERRDESRMDLPASCQGLTRGRAPIVHFGNFDREPQHELVEGWLRRSMMDSTNPFERMIYCWIAFNAWGACVTDAERDREWVNGLMRNRELNTTFAALLAEDGDFRVAAEKFLTFFPIFKVQELRQQRLDPRAFRGRRDEMVNDFLANEQVTEYEPSCARTHRGKGEAIPLDWPHTLASLYRVRNNLFHGEKGVDNAFDREIVSAAHGVLSHFLSRKVILSRI